MSKILQIKSKSGSLLAFSPSFNSIFRLFQIFFSFERWLAISSLASYLQVKNCIHKLKVLSSVIPSNNLWSSNHTSLAELNLITLVRVSSVILVVKTNKALVSALLNNSSLFLYNVTCSACESSEGASGLLNLPCTTSSPPGILLKRIKTLYFQVTQFTFPSKSPIFTLRSILKNFSNRIQ